MSRLDKSAYGAPEKVFRGRRNADSLVGIEGSNGYHAPGYNRAAELAEFGRKSDGSPDDGLPREIFDGTLRVRGICLGTAVDLTPRIMPGKLPQELLAMGGWKYSGEDGARNIKEFPDQLWKSIIADRIDPGKHPEGYYKRACLWCLQRVDTSGDVDVLTLLTSIPQGSERETSPRPS